MFIFFRFIITIVYENYLNVFLITFSLVNICPFEMKKQISLCFQIFLEASIVSKEK